MDRARFPSEIPHGHFIHRHGPRRLARWGLLERVLDTGCPPVTSITMDLGDFPLAGHDLGRDGVPVGLGPRRAALDGVLVDAAVEAGAELREGFAVDDLSFDDGRVTGSRGRARDGGGGGHRGGPPRDRRGRAQLERRQARPRRRHESAPTLTCWYFSYWSGVAGDGLELYVLDRRVIFAFPTNDGLFAVFVAWPFDELATVRADPERELLAAARARIPRWPSACGRGRREERVYGAADLPNFVRTPDGPGWALVGDAGCHKDPYLALGICDAFRDAELLADALGDVLSGRGAEARRSPPTSGGATRRRCPTITPTWRWPASGRCRPSCWRRVPPHAATRRPPTASTWSGRGWCRPRRPPRPSTTRPCAALRLLVAGQRVGESTSPRVGCDGTSPRRPRRRSASRAPR